MPINSLKSILMDGSKLSFSFTLPDKTILRLDLAREELILKVTI